MTWSPLKDLSIKRRFVASTTVLVVLFLVAFFAYNYSLRGTELLNQVVWDYDRFVLHPTSQIDKLFEQVRISERDFLLDQALSHTETVYKNIEAIFADLDALEKFSLAKNELELVAAVNKIRNHILNYRLTFKKVIDAHVKQGLSHEVGLQGRFRDTVHLFAKKNTTEHAIGLLVYNLDNLAMAETNYSRGGGDTRKRKLFQQRVAEFRQQLAEYPLPDEERSLLEEKLHRYQETAALLGSSMEPFYHITLQNLASEMRSIMATLYVPNIEVLLLQLRRS